MWGATGKMLKRTLQTLGELWLQAFVSNLKTKSSGNIKTSLKNNINIFCGLYMAQYYPRHVHDTKKQFSHTPISINSFIANKAMDSNSKSFFQGKKEKKNRI